jgi:diacylglycerol kinase
MAKPAARVEGSDLPSNVELFSEAERARLTAKTTERYSEDLQNLLIPASWRKKTGRSKNLLESFYHAFEGVCIGLQRERNLRIHFCLVPVVCALAVWLHIDVIGWLALILSMSFVIAAEFLNTAIEHMVDISTDGQYHLSAKYAKDTAAAAVLFAAATAALVGLVVFGPKLFDLLLH